MTVTPLDRADPPTVLPAAAERRLRFGALGWIAGSALGLAAAGLAMAERFDTGAGTLPLAAGVFAALGVVVLASLAGGHPHPRFGPANGVTTVRAAMTALLAALLPEAGRLADPSEAAFAWTLTGWAVAALLLDGIDGQAARRSGLASRFGARYDMEVDALLVLVLSLFAFASGKAGLFVVAIGLMRYLFLGLLRAVPGLDRELAPSVRRKAVCVVQVGALCLLLAPALAPPVSSALALAALAALLWSFGADLVTLERARRAA